MLAPEPASSPRISADPDALDRFANGTAARTQGVEAAAGNVERAVAAWNHAPCDPRFAVHVPPLGNDIAGVVGQWVLGDTIAARTAAAFRAADGAGGGHGVVRVPQRAVDDRLRAKQGYDPISSIREGDHALWARLTGADKCYRGGKYLGGGFITAPDGRVYPLVIPQVFQGGKTYQADDGGPGDVATLDGSDPGWVQIGEYADNRALFPTNSRNAFLAGLFLGATNAKVPAISASDPSDYAGLRIGDGRPVWFPHGVVQGRSVDPMRDVGPSKFDEAKRSSLGESAPGATLTRSQAKGAAALFPVQAFSQALSTQKTVENAHHGAYRLVLERNLDGRVRARLALYAMKTDDDGDRVIMPMAVGGGGGGAGVGGQIIHYRPHVDPPGAQASEIPGKYHLLHHFERGKDSANDKLIQDVYDDGK